MCLEVLRTGTGAVVMPRLAHMVIEERITVCLHAITEGMLAEARDSTLPLL